MTPKTTRRMAAALNFDLPPNRTASAPPEVRGPSRDHVRLMVQDRANGRLRHARFRDLPDLLEAGDALILNTSRTLPAALPARTAAVSGLVVHLSARLGPSEWIVEVRQQTGGGGSAPFSGMTWGDVLHLPGDRAALLTGPYGSMASQPDARARLWRADLDLGPDWQSYLELRGQPIRYGHATERWPITYYQTVYADEPGSAEMPSAGRPFTRRLLHTLEDAGVGIGTLILHCGVSSLEQPERPHDEYYRVPAETAELVNATKASGRRVVAVGTTVVRALESAAATGGTVRPTEGWTGMLIGPDRPPRVVDGLLTGLHEPRSTHLGLLGALTSVEHLRAAYRAALLEGYLWHEFGDSHVLL